MSAYEDLHVSLPAASRLIGAHGAAYLICAMLGCLVAFLVFESRAALLVTAWWCLTMVIVRSDLDDFIIPNWATAGIVLSGICFTLATTLGAFVHLSAMEVITAPLKGAL
jgi:hypothetical protein